MSKNKLQKFAELKQLANVIEAGAEGALTDAAQAQLINFCSKRKPIILELACGRGEYTLALAKQISQPQVIGIDIQGERIYHGAQQALQEKLSNVLFLRTRIEFLVNCFPTHMVDEIWLTFPDPYPKKRHQKRRLTAAIFLSNYQKILKPQGVINLKTDDEDLFNFSLEAIRQVHGKILLSCADLYQPVNQQLLIDYPILSVQTHFEKKHLAHHKTIKYLRFLLL